MSSSDETQAETQDDGLYATLAISLTITATSLLLFFLWVKFDPRWTAPICADEEEDEDYFNENRDINKPRKSVSGSSFELDEVEPLGAVEGSTRTRASLLRRNARYYHLKRNYGFHGKLLERGWRAPGAGEDELHDMGLFRFVRPEKIKVGITGLGWIWRTYQVDERDLLDRPGGTDYVIYLRFLKYTTWLFTLLSVLGIAIVLPVNSSGGNKDLPHDDPEHVGGLIIYTLANVEVGSDLLWFHLIATFVFSALVLLVPVKIFHDWTDLLHEEKLRTALGDTKRVSVAADGTKSAPHTSQNVIARTVMVYNLKRAMSSQDLLNMFRSYYGGRVLFAYKVPFVPDLCDMQALLKLHKAGLREAVDFEQEHGESQMSPFPSHRKLRKVAWPILENCGCMFRCCGNCGVHYVEAKQFHAQEYAHLRQEVFGKLSALAVADAIDYDAEGKVAESELGRSGIDYSRAGFVVFDMVATAQACAQTLHSAAHNFGVSTAPPNPGDVMWESVTLRTKERWIRKILGWAALTTLFFVRFSPPDPILCVLLSFFLFCVFLFFFC
jgi:Late exocytosis, associated with Golgi transport/Cytosolic domain of 10TM putative phosphate transporter